MVTLFPFLTNWLTAKKHTIEHHHGEVGQREEKRRGVAASGERGDGGHASTGKTDEIRGRERGG